MPAKSKKSKKSKLSAYREKRKFDKTPEPGGKLSKGRLSEGNRRCPRFVVHFHKATHDHYDLRLEMQGVLKSWAIPKTPPTTKNIKRLAIQVEDHPLEYAKFQGIIPKGQYGAGIVKIWDKGTYKLIEKTSKKIIINLKGKKLRGHYALIKTSYGAKPGKSWLFFKV